MSASLSNPGTGSAARPEPRPFIFLTPSSREPELTAEIHIGIAELMRRVEPHVTMLMRGLVEFSLAGARAHGDAIGRRRELPLSVRNRRRRAARLWINAILAGRTDAATQDALTGLWLPQLAGTGPERAQAVAAGKRFVEYLRGGIVSVLFDRPENNLVTEAYALTALETILAVHLRAIEDIPARARRI